MFFLYTINSEEKILKYICPKVCLQNTVLYFALPICTLGVLYSAASFLEYVAISNMHSFVARSVPQNIQKHFGKVANILSQQKTFLNAHECRILWPYQI